MPAATHLPRLLSPPQCAAPPPLNRPSVRTRAIAFPHSFLHAESCLRTPQRCGFPNRPLHRPRARAVPAEAPASELPLPYPSQSAFLQFRTAPPATCSLRLAPAGKVASSDCFCRAGGVLPPALASAPQSPPPLPLLSSRRTSGIPASQMSDAVARPTKSFSRYQCNLVSPASSRNFRTRSTIRIAPESPSAEISGTPSFETTSIPYFAPSRMANSSKAPADAAGNSAPCSSCRSSSACPASPRGYAFRKSVANAPVAATLPRCADTARPAKSLGQSSSKTDAFPPPRPANLRVPPPPPTLRASGASRRASPPRPRKSACPSLRWTGASHASLDPQSPAKPQTQVASRANVIRT